MTWRSFFINILIFYYFSFTIRQIILALFSQNIQQMLHNPCSYLYIRITNPINILYDPSTILFILGLFFIYFSFIYQSFPVNKSGSRHIYTVYRPIHETNKYRTNVIFSAYRVYRASYWFFQIQRVKDIAVLFDMYSL